MTKLRLVRGSEVSSFLTDRKAWKLRWVDHLVKKQQDGKLFFGNLFHKYLEIYYNHKGTSEREFYDWLQDQDTSAMDQVFYAQMNQLFHDVQRYYKMHYDQDFARMQIIDTEVRFAIPIFNEDDEATDFAYEGTIDLLYVEDGKLKFMDHKTVSSIDRYVNNAVLDRQISRYWWALTALSEGHGYVWENESWVHVSESRLYLLSDYGAPQEFVYNIIRKDFPKPPRVLKNKTISVANPQSTTYELYMEAIHQNGLNVADYSGILETLQSQGNKFIRRVSVVRNWSECEAAIEDFAKTAIEMLEVRAEVTQGNESRIYWNITWDTPTFNQYYPLIQAEVMGESVSMVRAALYTTEEWDEEENFIEVGD